MEEKCPIKIFSAISPREELTSVAITIKHLVAEQGYQYRDFAIVTLIRTVYLALLMGTDILALIHLLNLLSQPC